LPPDVALSLLDHCGVDGRRACACTCKALYGGVLVGRGSQRNHETLYVIGEEPGDATSPLFFEGFNMITKKWNVLASPGPCMGARMAAVGRQLYLTGGAEDVRGERCEASKKVQVFNLQSKMWCTGTPMRENRCHHAVTVAPGGMLFCIGGTNEMGELDSGEVFEEGAWEILKPMRNKRAHACAVFHRGKIYVIGGVNRSGELRTVESWDHEQRMWQEEPSMLYARQGPSAVVTKCAVANGKTCIVVTGGSGSTAEYLDVDTGKWFVLPPMTIGRGFGGLTLLDGNLVAVGGIQDTDNDGRFDDLTSSTTELLNLNLDNMRNGRNGPMLKTVWEAQESWGKFGRCQAIMG